MKYSLIIFVIAICTLIRVDESSTQLLRDPGSREVTEIRDATDSHTGSVGQADDLTRKQRSSFYDDGEDEDSDDYTDYSDGPEARHRKHGHKKKKHRKSLLHHLLGGHGGCRGHGCGGDQGWQSQFGGHNQGFHGSNQGGSSASASAGSSGGSSPHGGGYSQANAHSTSFNFGPYAATFSTAQASSSGNRHGGNGDYYDY